ncbi:MAG: RluA family pseudouridine synthase [Planctomycetes bacterium]|nr:RluA family pseudouridine synthase [Planctomycetota bacterium]
MPIDPSKPYDLSYVVDPNWVELRLDQFVKTMVPSMSRTKIQKYIKNDRIEVNGISRPANWRVRLNDSVILRCNEPEGGSDAAKDIPIEVIYEDDDILAVNKQSGLIVHPVGKNRHNTLLNALYFRYKDILPEDQEISLANRIDQHTSGIILVAKNTEAKRIIQEDFEARVPKKAYMALVEGIVEKDEGEIDLPIGPAPCNTDHCKMGIRMDEEGKPSLSFFKVIERFPHADCTLVRLEPHTGRQHQLRVHMAHEGHPLLCDDRYNQPGTFSVISPDGEKASISRYALHAAELNFEHPISKEQMKIIAPLAEDMQSVLDGLRKGWAAERDYE